MRTVYISQQQALDLSQSVMDEYNAFPGGDTEALCKIWLEALKVDGRPVACARALDGSFAVLVEEKDDQE